MAVLHWMLVELSQRAQQGQAREQISLVPQCLLVPLRMHRGS